MTAQKRPKKRTASTSIAELQLNVVQETFRSNDLIDDFEFLIPNELSSCAIGFLHCLTTKRLIPLSFSTLYHQSRKANWFVILNRERRNLKSNINSTEKCFMLNRLINECRKNPNLFVEEATTLYDSIARQMVNTDVKFENVENWCRHVVTWQSTQSYRRLFHIKKSETDYWSTVFDLQRGASRFFTNLIISIKNNSSNLLPDQYAQLKQILQNLFVITIQPSTVECAGGTKYEKVGRNYISKLNSRLLCLLDTDSVSKHLNFSKINVTLYPFDRTIDKHGEEQSPLEWQERTVIDAHGVTRTFLYVDLQGIRLNKLDMRNARPLYSSKLCQIQYKFQIKIHSLGITEDLTFISRPFGLCSHAQYFPEYLAKIFLYEFQILSQNVESPMILPLMTDFLGRYQTKICGVPVQNHTKEFIMQMLQTISDRKNITDHSASIAAFEGILAKFFSQMEFFVDHPFLSMMYHDGLFRGICDGSTDRQLKGTRDKPEVLLRFNTLIEHQPTQQAAVRYIVHNGQLIRASFHMKAFVDEMCRVLYESTDDKIIVPRIHADIPDLDFRFFRNYYDDELVRISGIEPARQEAYKPLIPVLWSTLRTAVSDENSATNSERLNSPTLSESESFKSNTSPVISPFQITRLPKKRPIASDLLIERIVEQFSNILIECREEETSSNSDSPVQSSFICLGNEEKQNLSEVLKKYLKTTAQASSDCSPSELSST